MNFVQLFPAHERRVSSTRQVQFHDWFYGDGPKKPFGPLLSATEAALAPGGQWAFKAPHPVELLLLPVVGGVEYTLPGCPAGFVGAEQVFQGYLPENQEILLENTYPEYDVNLLVLAFQPQPSAVASQGHTLHIPTRNALHVQPLAGRRLSVALLDGRVDGAYTPPPGSELLFFVLKGYVEVSGRLLHTRDAMRLTAPNAVDWEALSPDAVLLLLE